MKENNNTKDAERWLQYAYEDLKATENMLHDEEYFPRHICWLAQQSAEKAIKSVLIYLRIDFPFKHDLDVLCDLIPADWMVKINHPDLAELTEWAVESRYPGDWPDPSESDSLSAVKLAKSVWNVVIEDFKKHGFPTQFSGF